MENCSNEHVIYLFIYYRRVNEVSGFGCWIETSETFHTWMKSTISLQVSLHGSGYSFDIHLVGCALFIFPIAHSSEFEVGISNRTLILAMIKI